MEEQSRLEVLHDHHKDSFSYIRDRERQRDRQFLILIGLFALLIVQVQYPTRFDGALEPTSIFGVEADLSALPFAALLSATWVLTLAITLSYCQVTVNVERQYGYLHELERELSNLLGNESLHRRESAAYLTDYPLFQEWAYFCYRFLFPTVAVLAILLVLWAEFRGLSSTQANKWFDVAIAVAIVVSLYLYRLHPLHETVREFWGSLVERWTKENE